MKFLCPCWQEFFPSVDNTPREWPSLPAIHRAVATAGKRAVAQDPRDDLILLVDETRI